MNGLDLLNKLFEGECFILKQFKIYCPGCGGTRAFLALLQGDISASLRYHPIVLLFILDVLLMTVLDIIRKKTKQKYRFIKFRIMVNASLLALIVVYFFARNLLFYGFGVDLLGDLS